LDWPDANLGNQTLRDLIMGIYSHEYPTLHLFHAVDAHWKGHVAGHIFSFFSQLEEDIPFFQAEDCAAQERIKLMFTPSAVKRASTSTWDIANHCVVSELDTKIDEFDDNPVDNFYIFTDVAKAVAKASDVDSVAKASAVDSTKPDATPSPKVGPSENDSVSTFTPGPDKRKRGRLVLLSVPCPGCLWSQSQQNHNNRILF
jgi:hypothetical protein